MSFRNNIEDKNFDELCFTYTNKNKLILKLSRQTKFFGFKPGDVLELSYCEFQMGEDENGFADSSKSSYVCTQTQFFPINKLREAIGAFHERLNSPEPWRYSVIFKSHNLEDCLITDTDGLKLEPLTS